MRPTTRDLYADVTAKIVEALEAGTVPWQRPWGHVRGTFEPFRNLHTNHEYRGVNVLLLTLASMEKGYTSPYWLTYNQARERGGQVRAGEKGTLIVFWKPSERPLRDGAGEVVRDEETDEPLMAKTLILKHFHVFNVEQCDGLSVPAPAAPAPVAFTPDERAEALWAGFKDAPPVRHGGNQAFYALPPADFIQMPPRKSFKDSASYYQVRFHEAIHSTGAPARLNRRTLADAAPFGSPVYGQEELVAEMGSAMLMAQCGMTPDIQNSAAYIRGWLKALQDDKRMLVFAAAQAEKAARYVQGQQPEAPAPTPAPAMADA
jgi:antirestriction protein ArdC